MDDDVLSMTKICAHAMGYAVLGENVDLRSYNPAEDDAQAFELLCWLAERGEVHWSFQKGGEVFYFWPDCVYSHGTKYEFPCHGPAELRLAIMRAVCKVKKGEK